MPDRAYFHAYCTVARPREIRRRPEDDAHWASIPCACLQKSAMEPSLYDILKDGIGVATSAAALGLRFVNSTCETLKAKPTLFIQCTKDPYLLRILPQCGELNA